MNRLLAENQRLKDAIFNKESLNRELRARVAELSEHLSWLREQREARMPPTGTAEAAAAATAWGGHETIRELYAQEENVESDPDRPWSETQPPASTDRSSLLVEKTQAQAFIIMAVLCTVVLTCLFAWHFIAKHSQAVAVDVVPCPTGQYAAGTAYGQPICRTPDTLPPNSTSGTTGTESKKELDAATKEQAQSAAITGLPIIPPDFTVEAIAYDKCWISLVTDDRKHPAYVIAPNEHATAVATDSVEIRDGCPGRLVFLRDGRVVHPTPEPGHLKSVEVVHFTQRNTP
jgi:hypothetical protein